LRDDRTPVVATRPAPEAKGDDMMTTPMVTTLPATGARGRIARVIELAGRFPLPVLQLLFRFAVASVFLKAGLNKLASWELTVQLFADEYKVPVLSPEHAALMSTTFEIGCSTLLILGLATRVATLPLLGMIAVIQTFVYPNAYSEHLTWGSILIFLLTRGAGPWSLDRALGLEPAETARR
jgi:putative oxidoreductase